MDFELSEEQGMLQDSVARFIEDKYQFASRQELAASAQGYSDANWTTFAEMGWLSLPFDEAYGGLNGSVVDMGVVAETLGTGNTLEPLLASVLLGGKMIESLGDETQKSTFLPAVIEGRRKLALAYSEPAAGFDLSFVETTAAGGVLNGHKCVVLNAASADTLIVVARTSGDVDDETGLSAFLVDANASGLRRQDYTLVDGRRASDVWFVDTPAEPLGDPGAAYVVLSKVIDEAICAICAEAVGSMTTVLDMTKDYVGTRQQFGRPIGDNQVIQHRIVDMFTAREEAKAITDMTLMKVAEGAPDRSHLVSGMKAKVGEAARFVGGQGVQVHGGIGMTDEYPIGHLYKRLMTLDALFGDMNHHLDQYAAGI